MSSGCGGLESMPMPNHGDHDPGTVRTRRRTCTPSGIASTTAWRIVPNDTEAIGPRNANFFDVKSAETTVVVADTDSPVMSRRPAHPGRTCDHTAETVSTGTSVPVGR